MNTETNADIRERVARAIQAVEFGYYENQNATTPKLITFEKLCNLAGKPHSLAKDRASVIAPHAAPAKTKDAVIEHDAMVLLWADIDDGDLSKAQVIDKVGALNCASLIYSTASSCRLKKGVLQGRRWRVVLPLKESISLDRYFELQSAIVDYFGGDVVSIRNAQIMYGPTNPPITSPEETRHYEYAVIDDELFDADNAPIEIKGILARLVVVEAAEAVAKDKLAHESIKTHREHIGGSNGRIIDLVNANHDLLQCFMRHGYRRIGKKFLSPNSSSESPGILILGDDRQRWFSHHESDKGIGLTVDGGQCGDAFDIICHYEYGGDISRAVADLANKLDPEGQKQRQREHEKAKAKSEEKAAENDDCDSELVHDFPVFNRSEFYGPLGELAMLAADGTEIDPVAVYFQSITAFAAYIGQAKHFYIGEDRHESRFFTAIVGNSSRARKGTSFKPVERAIRKVEDTYNKASKSLLAKSPLVIKNGGLSSAEGLIYAVRDESDQVTGKEMKPLWEGVDDKRLLIVEGELGSVFKVCQREGNTLSPLLRVAWDGGTLSPMTKNSRLTATNPHVNIIGHITNYELKSLLSGNDIYNGLVNRMLWACVRRTGKIPFPKRMDQSKLLNIAIRISQAILKTESADADEIRMSDEAREFWGKLYQELSADLPGVLGAATSRNEALASRLALLFCVLDGEQTISLSHIKAADAVVSFSMASCRYLFTVPSSEAPDSQKLLAALSKGPLTQTEISKLFNNHKSRTELASLLGDLQSLNKIRKLKTPGSKTITWEAV